MGSICFFCGSVVFFVDFDIEDVEGIEEIVLLVAVFCICISGADGLCVGFDAEAFAVEPCIGSETFFRSKVYFFSSESCRRQNKF